MFGAPMVFAFVGSEHTDYRHRRGSGGQLTPEKEATTSNLPFLALLQGKQQWGALGGELKDTNAALAVAAGLLLAMRRLRMGF